MKYIHFEASDMLAGVANMLECCGHHSEDYQIALGMDAPWLFLKKDGCFLAGQGLYKPEWLNLYLLPKGFCLTQILLPKDEIPAFLRSHPPAMLTMYMDRGSCHPVVYTRYENMRYLFTNIKAANSPEPDQLSLSRTMLLRRLDDEVPVLTLEKCQAQPTDFIPLLVQSLHTLLDYESAIMEACSRTITREDMASLRTPLLRALLVDMPPMALLLRQPVLYEELRLLHHDYRHVFTRNSPQTVDLWEHLSRSSIRKCISWLMENIKDRLYDHGLTDDQVAEIFSQVDHKH